PPLISTLSLHDALPICRVVNVSLSEPGKRLLETLAPLYRQIVVSMMAGLSPEHLRLLDDLLARLEPGAEATLAEMNEDHQSLEEDRKSTRLNSSHVKIS